MQVYKNETSVNGTIVVIEIHRNKNTAAYSVYVSAETGREAESQHLDCGFTHARAVADQLAEEVTAP